MSSGNALNYETYPTGEAEEWLLRIGEAEAEPILVLAPFLEEMNRTRALIVAMMRALAADGFGCWLPDLPGCGESPRPLEGCGWRDWRRASGDAAQLAARRAGRPVHVAAIRGGALLDGAAEARSFWRFAPATGASLVRDLERSSLVGASEQSAGAPILAGYPLAPALIEAIRVATPAECAPLRTLRLDSDRTEADAKLEGPALWRRSEPGFSPALAAALAADLGSWIRQCAAC